MTLLRRSTNKTQVKGEPGKPVCSSLNTSPYARPLLLSCLFLGEFVPFLIFCRVWKSQTLPRSPTSPSPRSSGPPCSGDRSLAKASQHLAISNLTLPLKSGRFPVACRCLQRDRSFRGRRTGLVSSMGRPGGIFQMRLSLCARTLCYHCVPNAGKSWGNHLLPCCHLHF